MNGNGVASSTGSLDALQRRVLAVLGALEPRFVLGGGGALILHFGHRTTRDLDLFWDLGQLGDVPAQVRRRLAEGGLSVATVQEDPTFVKLRVTDTQSVLIVDLIAETIRRLSGPEQFGVDGVDILAESKREMLINKLCALISRSELRDLVDVEVLVAHGGDLQDAADSAPEKDSGFSPLTLAWVLRDFDVPSQAAAHGLETEDAERLERFRRTLIDTLLRRN